VILKWLSSVSRARVWVQVVLPLFAFAALILLMCWLWLVMTSANMFAFRQIKIQANYGYIATDELQELVRNHVHGGFFSIDLSRLKEALLRHPWVNQVAVRRVWPATLVVIVSEHRPLARWNQDGVISDSGVVFTPQRSSIPKELPQFFGDDSSAMRLLGEYHTLQTLLLPLKLELIELEKTARDSWRARLSNGLTIILGREDIDARLEKLVVAYPRLRFTAPAEKIRVDLRYPNGFAVREN